MSTITKKAIAEFRLLQSKYPKMNTKDVIQLLERIDLQNEKLLNQKTLIAVFTRTEKDFHDLRMTPKSNYIRVRDKSSIRGIEFTGVIQGFDWYKDDFNHKRNEAYDYLHVKQPNIF
jgi:hypothetical protein